MKKWYLFGVLALVAALTLIVSGVALAQDETPPAPETPYYGPGMMNRPYDGERGGWAGRGAGRGGWGMSGGYYATGEYGPMHDAMMGAFAEAFGLSQEELEARQAAGETMWEIAEAQGFSAEEFASLMTEARSEALEQAVAEGTITQEQADWMIQRMAQRQAYGYGPGSSACTGSGPTGSPRGGARGGRWSNGVN